MVGVFVAFIRVVYGRMIYMSLPSEQELFIRFTVRAFRKLLSIYVFRYFPFGFEAI